MGPLLWLAGPLAFIFLFYVIPLGQILTQAFVSPQGHIDFDAFLKIFMSPYYRQVLGYTVSLGLITSVICIFIGYPVAYYINCIDSLRIRRGLLILTISSLFVSNIVRAFAWIIILGQQSFLNKTLVWLNIVESPIPILYTDTAIQIGMIYVMTPFVVLAINAALKNIDPSILQASSDLGASGFMRFITVTLPLSIPGIVASGIIVFSLSVSAYVTPSIMSGGKRTALSMLIYQQYVVTFDERMGGALAIVLLALTIILVGMSVAALRWIKIDT